MCKFAVWHVLLAWLLKWRKLTNAHDVHTVKWQTEIIVSSWLDNKSKTAKMLTVQSTIHDRQCLWKKTKLKFSFFWLSFYFFRFSCGSHFSFHKLKPIIFVGIECTRCWLFLPMFAVSVCLSVTRRWRCTLHAVSAWSFGAVFTKCLWPLVTVY